MRPVEMEKPTIKVFTSRDHGRDHVVREVLHGIEEEGLPYEVTPDLDGSAMKLAWDASNQSRLNVGIGLDRETLVLHFSKMKMEQPLFQISARSPEQDLRAMGSNAARLVKRLPFKQLNTDH